MQPKPRALFLRREIVPRPKPEQDVRDLRDGELAGAQERRCVRRALLRAAHNGKHRLHAALTARDVLVGRARVLERQPHEFTAALDLRPVVELVAHAGLLVWGGI